MKPEALIRMLVLAEISDDYEEPQHVYENVSVRARLCGIPVERLDVQRVLLSYVDAGLARAYHFDREIEDAATVTPGLDEVGHYYFKITKEGLAALDSSGYPWPFDDEGDLLPDWRPPTS
jgi:hypothetical protein